MNSKEPLTRRQETWSGSSRRPEQAAKPRPPRRLSERGKTESDGGRAPGSEETPPNRRGRGSEAERKALVRKELLEKRKNLSPSLRLSLSRRVCEFLFSQDAFRRASSVALYFPANGEVDTREIFEKCAELGKKAFFPRTRGSGLVFLRTRSLDELRPGAFGIAEPPEDAEPADARGPDLVLVPGIAFDASGNRVGYGKGFYDRFLKDVPRRGRFALAYRFQVLGSVPSLETDIKVGSIVTETGVTDCFENQGD